MKSFREQLSICKDGGFTGKGPTLCYKKFPELLPFDPKIRRMMLAKENGLPTISCNRFGGICHSGKLQCRTLRGLKVEKHDVDNMVKYEEVIGAA